MADSLLDESQQDILVQMHDITKLDLDECRRLLLESGWDLELAISKHFQDGPPIQELEPESPSTSWAVVHSSVAPLFALARLVSNFIRRTYASLPILQQISSSVYVPITYASAFFRVVGQFIWSLFFTVERSPSGEFPGYDDAPDPVDEVLTFIRNFVQKYGSTYPSFYHGSFNQVTRDCVNETRCLLVYLHDNYSLSCDRFCREILCNPDVIRFIDEQRLLFWACSVDSLEGLKVSQRENVRTCPFLGFYLPQQGRMELFTKLSNVENDESLYRKIRGIIANTQHLMAAEAERRSRIIETVHIRKEQDENFQRSLEADKLKAQKKEEEERINRERMEKDRMFAVELENLRKAAQDRVNSMKEPDTDCDGVVWLAIRVPDGTCLRRRFVRSDPIEDLCVFLRSSHQVPAHFDLYTNFPKKLLVQVRMGDILQSSSLSLQDIGLTTSQGLFIHDIDA